jgi:hypothetical protein
MRDVVRGCSSYFVNDYAAVRGIRAESLIALAQANWVGSKVDAIKEKAEKDLKHNRLYGGILNIFTLTTTILTIVTVSIVIFSLEEMTGAVITVNDPINNEPMIFSAYTFIKILMIVLINSVAIIAFKRGSLRFSKVDQAEASLVLFDSALSKLKLEQHTSNRKAVAARMAVFHELGTFSLQESADYAVEALAAGEVKRPTLLNSRNRVKGGDEGDAYKAAEEMLDRTRRPMSRAFPGAVS